MKLKVYFHSNIDGTHSAMVAAPNQKEAAELFHTSVRDLRTEGYVVDLDKIGPFAEFAKKVLETPGKIFKKKIMATTWESKNGTPS